MQSNNQIITYIYIYNYNIYTQSHVFQIIHKVYLNTVPLCLYAIYVIYEITNCNHFLLFVNLGAEEILHKMETVWYNGTQFIHYEHSIIILVFEKYSLVYHRTGAYIHLNFIYEMPMRSMFIMTWLFRPV